MTTIQIHLSDEQWQHLQRLAEQCQRAPEALAGEVLAHWLELEEQHWQQRMERVLEIFRRHTHGVDQAEIEREITAAFEEYRTECAR